MRHQQEGINKLERINENVSKNGPYRLDVAKEKVTEMKEVREKLLVGEQEKIKILQELLRQRNEYQTVEYLPNGNQVSVCFIHSNK